MDLKEYGFTFTQCQIKFYLTSVVLCDMCKAVGKKWMWLKVLDDRTYCVLSTELVQRDWPVAFSQENDCGLHVL